MKTLKTLHNRLKSFAKALSDDGIRYHIGHQCLMIPYIHECKSGCPITTHKQKDMIYVSWSELPSNVILGNNPKAYRIGNVPVYYDEWWSAIGYINRFLNQEKAWQKGGIDTRKA